MVEGHEGTGSKVGCHLGWARMVVALLVGWLVGFSNMGLGRVFVPLSVRGNIDHQMRHNMMIQLYNGASHYTQQKILNTFDASSISEHFAY